MIVIVPLFSIAPPRPPPILPIPRLFVNMDCVIVIVPVILFFIAPPINPRFSVKLECLMSGTPLLNIAPVPDINPALFFVNVDCMIVNFPWFTIAPSYLASQFFIVMFLRTNEEPFRILNARRLFPSIVCPLPSIVSFVLTFTHMSRPLFL